MNDPEAVWIMEYWFNDDRTEVAAFYTSEAAIHYAESSYGKELQPHPEKQSWRYEGGAHQIVVFRVSFQHREAKR